MLLEDRIIKTVLSTALRLVSRVDGRQQYFSHGLVLLIDTYGALYRSDSTLVDNPPMILILYSYALCQRPILLYINHQFSVHSYRLFIFHVYLSLSPVIMCSLQLMFLCLTTHMPSWRIQLLTCKRTLNDETSL